ncbi:MAG: hypothetical protein R3B70_23965 [Polyangiaceae bacterium]
MLSARRAARSIGACLPLLLAASCSASPPAEVPRHDHAELEKRVDDEVMSHRLAGEAAAARLDTADKDRKSLTERIAALETRLATLESRAPAGGWSCAGKCQLAYSCTSSGSSNIDWRDITGRGDTAADAWKDLNDKCKDVVFVQAKCDGGRLTRTDATIPNACAKN